MIELTTAEGVTFRSAAYVTIEGKTYDVDELTDTQRGWVLDMLNIQGMSAAWSGQATVKAAQPLPEYEDIFGEREEQRA